MTKQARLSRDSIIYAKEPDRGDLVVGHRVFAFLGGRRRYAVPGEIVEALDHTVVVQVRRPTRFNVPKLTRWTWRPEVRTYQRHGQPTRPEVGLFIDPRPRKSS